MNFVKCLQLLRNGVTTPLGPQKNTLLIFYLDSRLGSFHLLLKYASEFSKLSVFLGDLPTITNESMLAHLMGGGRRNEKLHNFISSSGGMVGIKMNWLEFTEHESFKSLGQIN